jgi:hypothetical protein
MKILFKSRRCDGATAEQIAALRLQEVAAVWKLVAQGVIGQIHFSPDGPTVIGVLECDGLEQAQAVMEDLPMPRAGLIAFDFYRLQPYDQFELLFLPEHRR